LMAGETGLVKYYENPVLTSSGEQRIIAWHNIVLTDEAGKIAGALSSGEDVTERKRAEDEQTARIRRVQRQQTATAKLAVHEAIVAGDFEQAARVITETASQAMEVERVGVWLLSGDRAELRCVDLFERTSVAHSEGMVLQASDCPRYFEAFETGVVIDAHDALADPRTNEFTEEHLLPLGITSMLDVAIRAQGEVVGVVCHEHVGEPRQWRTDEITFAGGVSDQMALALLNAERRQVGMERELLLAQIREQARRVQQIIDTVPEGVLLLDADRRIILANPMAEKELAALASVAVGDVITHLAGQPVEELLTSPPKGLWHELAINGRSFQIIARPTEASDFTVIGLAETGPVSSGWVLVIRDVTQQREIERRVHQRDKLVAVGQLAAGIAHDFNNIMATIVLYAQMTARTSGLPNRVQDWMATIDQQAKHATDLIRQILDFGRRAALERRPLDLVPFLKEQVQMLKRILPENIDIGLVYGPNEYVINADLTGIQQIVMNLAVNARDAMPEGGRLRIELERMRVESRGETPLPEMEVGDWVQVTVSDTGVGIPSDVLPYIFDPFFTTKALGEGTGLGLAQVHGIVGSHGGFMDVKTQVGQGTAFIIYLPALLMHSSEPSVVASFAGPLSLVKGHGETILVVEDNATARRALVESLEQLNYQVLEAANGQDALDILERHASAAGHDVAQIALVVSDVVMPEMSGIALLRSMKDRGLIVGVLLLTGHPLERELEDLRAQRAASLLIDWLPKPPSLEQLAAVVARGVKKHPVDL
jgi:two-component system cell cycle sensor histidine kinase/response regulator CckA